MKILLLIPSLALALAAPAVQAQERGPLVVTDTDYSEVMLLRLNATSRCQQDCVVRGAPYSAERVSEAVQVLADGNRIVTRTSEQLHRDAEGRSRVESAWLGRTLVQIQDPVQNMSYRLHPAERAGLRMAMGAPAPAARTAAAAVSGAAAVSIGAGKPAGQLASALASATDTADSQRSTRSLGTRQFDGVTAEGTLQTTTIPAGTAGNTLPIVATTETWHARDLKLDLYVRTVDPRLGERVTRLENLRRGDPPASLFAVPADYSVREIARR
jgi:hypothetical protein